MACAALRRRQARGNSSTEVLRLPLSAAASEGRSQEQQLRATVEPGGWSPIHLAAGGNDSVGMVKRLVNYDPSLMSLKTHADGYIAMHCAAAYNPSVEIVKYCIQAGGIGQLSEPAGNGARPLHLAVRSASVGSACTLVAPETHI